MKAFLLLLALLIAVSSKADTLVSRLDCQASNGVSITTIRPHLDGNSPLIVEATWFGLSATSFSATLLQSKKPVIVLANTENIFFLSLNLNMRRMTAQNIGGFILTKANILVSPIYCTVELEK